MLEPDSINIDGKLFSFQTDLRGCEDLPVLLQFWMAYVARDLLQLGVFFRAAAIMLQVPGAGRYQFVFYDDYDDDFPDQEGDPHRWVAGADDDTVFNVLADCLRRLDVGDLIEQVPGATDYERVELSDEWKEYLDSLKEIEHGLLNIIAECLDRLMIGPGMAEIGAVLQPTWWEKFWSRL